MTRLIYPTLAALGVTGATDGAMKLLESQSIGIPAAVAIFITVFTAARWLEHRFTRLEERLNNLPCQAHRDADCEDKPRHKHR